MFREDVRCGCLDKLVDTGLVRSYLSCRTGLENDVCE